MFNLTHFSAILSYTCRFACTKGCSFSCSEARKLHKKGHELAVHTVRGEWFNG